MSWKKVKMGSLLTESKIESSNPNPEKRIRVRLNVKGVEKRPDKSEVEGATKQYIRKANQFIYGKQNFHKGAFGIIPKELDEFESSSDIPSFDVSLNCLPEWIFYFFKDKDRYLQLEKYATGVGSKRISPKKIFDIEIPLPPIAEQKIITNKIKASEEKDAQLQLQINNQKIYLKNLRKQILQDAIEGKLTKEWREKNPDIEPASELLKKIKQEKERLIIQKKIKKEKPLPSINESEIPFELPENWVWKRLGEVTNIVRGGSPRPAGDPRFYDGNIPFLKVADLTASTEMYLDKHKYTIKDAGLHKTRLVPPNTLMLTNSGATLGIPKICNFSTTFNDGVAAFIYMNEDLFKPFFYFFLKSKTNWFLKEASKGQGQPNLNTDIIGDVIFGLPPLAEQQAIVSMLQTLMQKLDEAEKQIENSLETSKLLTKAILTEAFQSHQVKVN